jgi:hypothetical protein
MVRFQGRLSQNTFLGKGSAFLESRMKSTDFGHWFVVGPARAQKSSQCEGTGGLDRKHDETLENIMPVICIFESQESVKVKQKCVL